MSIEILNVDCMEYMATCEDNAFDLAIVDPPYGINESGGKNKTRDKAAKANDYLDFYGGDKEPPSIDYFRELKRVSVNQVIWGANHFADLLNERSPCWLVWDKQNGTSHFADCELAYTSFRTAVRKFVFTWNGMLQGDMKNKEHRIHPTQKPVKLYQWILEKYSKPGQRIFDSHAGSMSSVIACHYFGCNIVACEIDKHYFDAGKKRVESETKQIDIFQESACLS